MVKRTQVSAQHEAENWEVEVEGDRQIFRYRKDLGW